MIEWMEEDGTPTFPATCTALEEPNGLLAAGGSLSPQWLLAAYQKGIFPWYDEESPILWWSPAPRAVITPDSFRIPRTVAKLLRRFNGSITMNQAFDDVTFHCAYIERRNEDGTTAEGTWITEDMLSAYRQLHRLGFAFSVENWDAQGKLVGGYYGIRLGAAVFGESMFSRNSNASQLAFAASAPLFFDQGIQMIDCQMNTAHMSRFGLQEITRARFESRLNIALSCQDVQLPSLVYSGRAVA